MAYQKQTFKDNETVLKAEHLRHMEEGIYQNSIRSGGMSATAVNLLIEILESAVYNANVSCKIASLKNALAYSGGSDGSGSDEPDEPVIPNEPDEPVADDITVADGSMTIVTVGSEISVSDGVMTIA